MSSRNPPYDLGESRRSPRSRSPGRYNEFRDEYRGGSMRGNERRRSIDSTSRPNFASNRDSFRDQSSRDSPRDFPSRDPPRGPKALIDGPPSGPRANSYSGDFRGDFGYRGDFRGSRGRPRGRGGWRDDSRDRAREIDRDYRGPRDDRGPPFRDDRGRDRDRWERNEPFRGRRPSPPSSRGRSPSYSGREPIRDAPASQDVDRLIRRNSRDGPLSLASPLSDAQSAFRGAYGRGRGIRGRGRGAYYDDFHGRNISPDSNWNRRTQPSATPPPQVPAFGSASTGVTVSTSNLKPPVTSTPAPPTGPASSSPIGVPVPTAPRSHAKFIRDASKATPNKWHNGEPTSPRKTHADVVNSELNTVRSSLPCIVKPPEALLPRTSDNGVESIPSERGHTRSTLMDKPTVSESVAAPTLRKRRLICGRRATGIPSKESVETPENASDDSDTDSVDSISRAEFLEGDLKQAEEEWSKIPLPLDQDVTPIPFDLLKLYDDVETEQYSDIKREAFVKGLKEELYAENLIALHALRPAVELDALLLTPYIETSMNDSESIFFSARQSVCGAFNEKECISIEEQADGDVAMGQQASPTIKDQQLPESEPMPKPFTRGKDLLSPSEAEVSDLEPESTFKSLVRSVIEPQGLPDSMTLATAEVEVSVPRDTNGKAAKPRLMLDELEKSEDELSAAEHEEEYSAVHRMMQTPTPSSLPDFGCIQWDQDSDFLRTLDPDPVVEVNLRKRKVERETRREKIQKAEQQIWKQRYHQYRRWTDFSDDPIAVRSRDRFAKLRTKAAAEAAAASASTPTSGTKPEPQRRTGSRWATDHDLERILQESKQEAKESENKERENEKEERDARAKNASAKEATIPDMYWDGEEHLELCFVDQTHLVPFERSFAKLEFGEPIDNFDEEECEIFEKVYLEMPKQWGKIAESLQNRNYKACIQHYYLIKHKSNLKEKFKKQGRKKGRRAAVPKGAKPKSNALTVDIVKGDDTEDGQDTENGSERRRPRRAAAPTFAFEATPGDTETQSSASTSTLRKPLAGTKSDSADTGPTKRRAKVPREKTGKQAKNSQLLAAAPSTDRAGEAPTPQPVSSRLEAPGQNRFPLQYDGANALSSNLVPSPYPLNDKATPSLITEFDSMSQSFPAQERLDSMTPTTSEGQDRRNLQQTSSYWSVPEQTDFPALLRHFGTDWHGIAKFMTSKTHIMVKNYYLRQVDSGRMSSWREIAEGADEQRRKGESTGPLPKPTIIPKRRIDGQTVSVSRPGSSMEGIDDMSPSSQAMGLQQGSPSQPTLSSRFPALAQAGPVPQGPSPSATPASILSKHLPQQSQQAAQQMQQSSRTPRGPALGYFNTDPQRPIMQAANTQGQPNAPMSDSISQRSLMVAQEAHLERQQALRLEREQATQAQAQAQAQSQAQAQAQAMQHLAIQRERQLQMKQESDIINVHQYEQYSDRALRASVVTRTEAPNPTRAAPPQQYQSRVRNIASESSSVGRELKSSPAPGVPRAPMIAPPASQDQYLTQSPSSATLRLEPARKSNIMSLLNDEPTDRAPPPKRVSDVTSATLQRSQTPPPQHSLQSSRYTGHPPSTTSQSHAPTPQQMPPQLVTQHQAAQSQHPYSQPPPYPTHQQPSAGPSTGPSRSYTPNNFEGRVYPQSAMPKQQSTYSQSSRQSLVSQPSRREPPLGDHHHGATTGYSHSSTPSQASIRMQESAYSVTPPPGQQPPRQQARSPLDHAHQPDREYYSRSSYQMQHQSSTVSSPHPGTTYHPQSQQQPSHRQMAFGGASHVASPPPQYSTQHSRHRSRRNSFDGRFPPAAASPTGLPPQGYTQAPQHQVTSLNPQYQQQHSNQDRYESNYERDRRLQDEHYHQRRLDDSRR